MPPMNPPVPAVLLEWLEAKFPNRLPAKEVSLYELAFLQGQQDIINRLKIAARKEQS